MPSRHAALGSHPVRTQSSIGSESVRREDAKTANTTDRPATTDPWSNLFYFTIRSDAPLLIIAVFCSVAASAATPAQAFIIGKVFDGFIKYAGFQLSSQDFLTEEQRWILGLTCIAAGSWLFHSLEQTAWMLFGEMQAERARRKLYSMLSAKEMAWYDLQAQGTSALLVSLEKDVRDMQLAVSQPFGGFIATVSTALISLGQAFYNSWKLTLVTLATSPLVLAVLWFFSSGMQKALTDQQSELSAAQKTSFDALSAIDTVKCANAEENELAKYDSKINAAAKYFYIIANKVGLQMGCLTFLVQAMFVQAFYYGGVLISNGEKTPAEVVTTFFSAIAAFQAIQGILPQVIVLERGRNAAGNLRALLGGTNATIGGEGLQQAPMSGRCGDIAFKNVSFCYPARPDQQVLRDISFAFPAGQTTFIIGRSGSGKSTIGQLLIRFYSPESGSISVAGVDIETMSAYATRNLVTLVEQTSVLFAGSILDNLRLAQLDRPLDKDTLRDALEFALLQSVVNDLPDGIDTKVGRGGASLSGGQCQRVALARARIRDTPVLILDESTSALDQVARDLIMAAIRHWRRKKTTIIITHEIRQLGRNDYAILMQDGRVVDQGRRIDLERNRDSPFQRLVASSEKTSTLPVAQHTKRISVSTASDALAEHLRARERDSRLTTRFLIDIPLSLSLVGGLHNPVLRNQSKYRDPTKQPASPDDDQTVRQDVIDIAQDEHARLSEGVRLKDWLSSTATFAKRHRAHDQTRSRRVVDQVLHTDDAPTTISKDGRSLLHILRQVWPNLARRSRLLLLIGFWGGTVHAVGSPVFAYVLSKLLELYAVPTDHSQQSLNYSLAILALAATDGVHFYLCRFMLEKSAQDWVDLLRSKALRRLIYQPRSYYDLMENNVLSISQDLDRSGEEMRNLLGRFIGLIYIAAVILISSIIWALTTHWKMTLFALATSPYISVVTYAYSKGSESMESLSDDAARKIALCIEETFSSIRTVRALNLEKHFESGFLSAMNEARNIGRRRALVTGFLYGLSDSASSFSIAFVFYVGSRLVSEGQSVVSILQVFVVLVFAITNVVAILDYIPQIGSAKITASRVLHLANMKVDSHESSGDVCLASIGNIDFNHLTFAYESRQETAALKDVTFTIEAGRSVAIVGGSGSGKSTVAKLLLKLYAVPLEEASQRPASSRVSGRPLRDINTTSLRSHIGVVLQSNPIFPSTVANNITYGLPVESPMAKHDLIVRAATQAGILDFVMSLPQGFETRIGDGGTALSGGQAQRIAIARALVRQPSALIFDEATSALDVESVSVIRATIRRLIDAEASMTIIIITHSKEMMEIAEDIIVLDRGRVVETGPYKDLVAQSGPLAHLLNSGVWDCEG